MGVTRRTLLGFGLGTAALAVTGVGGLAVTGNLDRAHDAIDRRLNGDGPNDPPPDVPTGGLETGTFRSAAMKNTDVDYAVSYPPGSAADAKLPVVLELYGRGGNHRTPFASDNLALDSYQAQVVGAGSRPFAVATIDAGPDSYWHKRASGIDPQRLILEAPAIFLRAADSSPVAFDGSRDFDANNVMTANAKLAGIPIRVACGTQDPFYGAVRQFVALPHSPKVEAVYGMAGHTPGYWRTETAAQLTFLARHLG